MFKLQEFIVVVIQVHMIPQNIFLMQNKISISFPRKIKNTSKENKTLNQKYEHIFRF